MENYILSLSLIIIGYAILFLESYWVRQNISLDSNYKEYGVPAYVSIQQNRDGSETSVHQENLFIYFAIATAFGFLAGITWLRRYKQDGQQGASPNRA